MATPVRSRLSSRPMLFRLRGGDVLLVPFGPRRVLRERLNLAISSPNTSPVRSADMRSSNSPLLLGSAPGTGPPFVPFECFDLRPSLPATELSRPSLDFRSIVRFFS